MSNRQGLFKIKKDQILNNVKNGTEKDYALAYALVQDCYPYFHKGFEEFQDLFHIKPDIQKPFYDYIEKLCKEKTYKTFYQIDMDFRYNINDNNSSAKTHDRFKWYMIIMLRYAVAAGHFSDDEFKNQLLAQGCYSIEARSIFKPIEIKDI